MIRLSLLTVTLALTGCLPEERIWWSPGGDRALISVHHDLHMVMADGKLGPRLLEDGDSISLSRLYASWLADGSGFVCQEEFTVRTWAEVRKQISAQEVAMVEQMLPAIPSWLDTAAKLAIHNDLGGYQNIPSLLQIEHSKRWIAALLVAHERDPAGIEAKLESLPKGKEIIESLHAEGTGFNLTAIALYKLTAGQKPVRTSLACHLLTEVGLPKVSPKHDAVAYLQLDEGQEQADLRVISLGGGPSLNVASRVGGARDWTADGRSLIFTVPLGEKNEKLQSINRTTVLQANGDLMKPAAEKQADGSFLTLEGPDRLAEAKTLVTAIMLDVAIVQALPAGGVLFASPPATLPMVGTGQDVSPSFFIAAADGKSVHPVPTAPGDLPAALGFFTASPDGKQVAVVEAETDVVAVVDLASGKMRIVSPKHDKWKCRTLPAWKSATELTFAALDAGNHPAWMLWSPSEGLRNLSTQWPADSLADWLTEEKPQEKKPDQTSSPVAKPGP